MSAAGHFWSDFKPYGCNDTTDNNEETEMMTTAPIARKTPNFTMKYPPVGWYRLSALSYDYAVH
eukprot:3897786-Amphidinium_carterae.1